MAITYINASVDGMSEDQYQVWRSAALRAVKDGVSLALKGNGFVSLLTEWED